MPTNFVSLPLKLVQPSIYATSIADDKYLHNTRLYWRSVQICRKRI